MRGPLPRGGVYVASGKPSAGGMYLIVLVSCTRVLSNHACFSGLKASSGLAKFRPRGIDYFIAPLCLLLSQVGGAKLWVQ